MIGSNTRGQMAVFSRKPKAQRLQSLNELDSMLKSGKPVLLDFMQVGCAPCQVMDGIVNELAREYGESAHIVKVDVGKVVLACAFNDDFVACHRCAVLRFDQLLGRRDCSSHP